MNIRAAVCIVALMVVASPTAMAAPGFAAAELLVAGNTRLEGDAAALFFTSLANGFSWELSADSAELTRVYATYRAVDSPLTPSYDVLHADPWREETIRYDAVTLSSSATAQMGALLALARAEAKIAASSVGLVQIEAVRDPTFYQGIPADAESDDGVQAKVEHQLTGTFLDATFAEGVYTLTGDLTLMMYGPAYTLETGSETVEWQTGEFETSRTAAIVEGRQERHTLALTNAILQLRATEPTRVVTTFPVLELDGTIKAREAEGSLVIAGQEIAAPADGSLTYTGEGELALAFFEGRVAITSPDSIAAATTFAPRGPPLLAIGAGAILALGALAAAIVLWLRRSRADDLELALLAIEERRWEDALPRLTRVARSEPDNVGIMIDRALCLEQVGRFEDAARSFESALRAAPALADAHYYYARTLAKMRQPDAARAHLEEALERDPRLSELMRAEPALRGL